MNAEQFKRDHPLDAYLASLGIKLHGGGVIKTAHRCANTEHKPGHNCVSVHVREGWWKCHDCQVGGDVITWMAAAASKRPSDILRAAGIGAGAAEPFRVIHPPAPKPQPAPSLAAAADPAEADDASLQAAIDAAADAAAAAQDAGLVRSAPPSAADAPFPRPTTVNPASIKSVAAAFPSPATEADSAPPPNMPKILRTYPYQDAFGKEVYEVVRLEPKSFRQRHRDKTGQWRWNMDEVHRVLYRLPKVIDAPIVALCEGEKDAETLTTLGYCGTCNVGGAGKWMEGYTETLAGKEVLIFGDNDKAGQDHVKLVFDSIAGKARQVRLIHLPGAFKDVTEYVESFAELHEAQAAIADLVAAARPYIRGIPVKLQSMADLEPRYQKYTANPDAEAFNLGKWLPSFAGRVRNLLPGEVVLIIGDTGSGKTALLQSIALAAAPLPTIMFEMELPAELIFERFVAAKQGFTGEQIEAEYMRGESIGPAALNHHFKNLFICDDANLTVDSLESAILHAELKIGQRPKVVLLDYIQLLRGEGHNRYDRASHAAESIKRIAKATGTIIVMASQRARPKEGEQEVALHDAKESGSLENSSGLVLGAWRDKEDRSLLHLRILKNTKGPAGLDVDCNFDGETMRITERCRFQNN
jgi:energy-coupling factor transporter ATP-binding protein EcfA2